MNFKFSEKKSFFQIPFAIPLHYLTLHRAHHARAKVMREIFNTIEELHSSNITNISYIISNISNNMNVSIYMTTFKALYQNYNELAIWNVNAPDYRLLSKQTTPLTHFSSFELKNYDELMFIPFNTHRWA